MKIKALQASAMRPINRQTKVRMTERRVWRAESHYKAPFDHFTFPLQLVPRFGLLPTPERMITPSGRRPTSLSAIWHTRIGGVCFADKRADLVAVRGRIAAIPRFPIPVVAQISMPVPLSEVDRGHLSDIWLLACVTNYSLIGGRGWRSRILLTAATRSP